MNDPMRILKADHRDVEKLLKQLGETEEGTERDRLTDELDTKLSAHMQIEESVLYPLVKTHVGAEDEEEAEIEHGLARETLGQLKAMTETPGFGAVVEMLAGGIGHHVEEEETQILPELKDALSREEWLQLGDAIAAAKADAGLPVPRPTPRRSSKRKATSTR